LAGKGRKPGEPPSVISPEDLLLELESLIGGHLFPGPQPESHTGPGGSI
jgi:hypothetical protein